MTIETLELPNTYQLHSGLHYDIGILNGVMQKQIEKELSLYSISHLQWCALSGIELEGHQAPSDLAMHIGISRPSLSRLLKAMISVDLVERKLGKPDGRTRDLSITLLGKQKLQLCLPLLVAHQILYDTKLSEVQLKEFKLSVAKLRQEY